MGATAAARRRIPWCYAYLEAGPGAAALVAGGALTATGEWVRSKLGFRLSVKALSREFRGSADDAKDSRASLSVADGIEWRRIKAALYAHERVVYANSQLGSTDQVLEYRARYTHRVASSNELIVGIVRGERWRSCAGWRRHAQYFGAPAPEPVVVESAEAFMQRDRVACLRALRQGAFGVTDSLASSSAPMPTS